MNYLEQIYRETKQEIKAQEFKKQQRQKVIKENEIVARQLITEINNLTTDLETINNLSQHKLIIANVSFENKLIFNIIAKNNYAKICGVEFEKNPNRWHLLTPNIVFIRKDGYSQSNSTIDQVMESVTSAIAQFLAEQEEKE